MANSTRRRSGVKPKFPLWLHTPSGQWCKTIRGHRYYFGATARRCSPSTCEPVTTCWPDGLPNRLTRNGRPFCWPSMPS